jgi:hypothetical protein
LTPLLLLLAAAGSSHATVIVYTTAASFQAAIGASATDTFAGFDLSQSTASPMTRVVGSFSYTASTGTVDGFFGGGTAADPFLSTNAAADTITLTNFSAAVFGVGGNFFDSNMAGAYTSGSITVTATDASGTVTRTIAPTSMTAGSFLGFVSNGPLTAVTVIAVQQGTTTFRWPSIDNLMLAAAPVPEAGTMALTACGLASIALLAHRRRRR